ncbi:aryl-alcohol dehydrogenase-like predicted oxidoreductase [Melghiribacillus thermohalophilus]|uniref:Aryl-alcohol dehydrogenase-like predicted oxidoreductase n=1 Tax=Melghiribacillus thermohalophilus TaxID=1324956 RepID=A0A4R3MXI9_9BACI|nr:aldo/keto reductase [Melghiribacillus thermohalophilus]TCT20497.1 aryl-alcohol dehydrogenase-like predicted oxidoreductase [Melghiribacillus thermohalophilus]
MNYRSIGDTKLKVSELSFGTWAIGGAWGKTDDEEALRALERAMEAGVNFFDTADVYGDGHSEELLARATKGKEDRIYIATKFCRAGDINDPKTYSEKSVRHYLENSLRRLKRERVDLYQVHCPPFEMIKDGRVFEVLDRLQQEGKVRYYGVSVESVEEGIYTIEHYPNVKSLQVIFNLFRQKPLEKLFPLAKEKGVGIIARVPLASGLLTGKFNESSTFEEDDHRNFNRNGELFNVGETFAGLEFTKGVELSRKLSWIQEGRGNMTRASLRWILDQDSISTVIPGFKNEKQVMDNLKALEVPSFTSDERKQLEEFYLREVHDHIRGKY